MNRRQFCKAAGIKAMSAGVWVTAVQAAHPATKLCEPEPTKVGSEVTFQGPFGIAVRADGSFYVAEIQGRRIAKFDSQGELIGYIRHIPGYGDLQGPFDVDCTADGRLFIADTRGNTILKLDHNEKLIGTIGSGRPSGQPGEFLEPHSVAANEAFERIYVADTLNYRIQIFDMEGRLLKVSGKPGLTGPDTYRYAVGIASDDRGYVYALNQYGGFINVYTPDGRDFVRLIGAPGYEPGQLNAAYSLTIHRGHIYVADTRNSRIQKFTLEGKLVQVFGRSEGDGTDQFNNPSGIGVDAQGNLYVADWMNSRIVKLDPKGTFLRQWGGPQISYEYRPPKIYERSPCRGPITIATYSDITKAGIDSAAQAGVDWIYASLGFDNRADKNDITAQSWNIKEQVDYARRKGVKTAISVAVYPMGAKEQKWLAQPELYMRKRGQTEPDFVALSYFFPEVRSWKARHIAEQTKRAGIDGIMLDYCRYPDFLYGYELAMIDAYKRETGIDAMTLDPQDDEWIKFRAKYITMFVTELRYELAQLDWPVEISVYGGPDWKASLKTVMRSWYDWVSMGIIDKLSLGLYSRDFESFYEGIRKAKMDCPEHIKVGIMVACWGGNLNSPALMKKAAEVSFAADADEFAVFRGDALNSLNLWGTLKDIGQKYKILL